MAKLEQVLQRFEFPVTKFPFEVYMYVKWIRSERPNSNFAYKQVFKCTPAKAFTFLKVSEV